MSTSKVIIVDYDCGNLFSLQRALTEVGVRSSISKDPKDVLQAEKLILPGVGAFGDGMKSLEEYGLKESLYEAVSKSTPILGICLGMQ